MEGGRERKETVADRRDKGKVPILLEE